MNKTEQNLLDQIINLHDIKNASYSIRKNGKCVKKSSNSEIEIVESKNGLDFFVKDNVQNKSLHLPVIITVGGLEDTVQNNFYIGKNCNITIVSGCGIHNTSKNKSSHSGNHNFYVGQNSTVKYIEKHYANESSSEKILNPVTKIFADKSSKIEIQTMQFGGVSYSNRKTTATLKENSSLVVKEKIVTSNKHIAKTNFKVNLKGKNSSCNISSRSVAKDFSKQVFVSNIVGENECFGHIECDAILLDSAVVESTPKITAKNNLASLTHEASIGKIASEQIIKLQTLGLSETQAQDQIIKGFLN